MNKQKKNKSFFIALFCYFRNILAVLGLIFLIYHSCFKVSVIYSNSMAPTLVGDEFSEKDYILTEKISYHFRNPGRWEIVNFLTQDELGSDVMKRVVALPEESISIHDNWVHINGTPLERSSELDFLKYYPIGNLHDGEEYLCDSGYFLLGDNSMDSYDSRYTDTLAKECIIGRAWMIIWPPSRIKFLTPH